MSEHREMDMNRQLMLDGNAVAGMLRSVFGAEMTTALSQCDHCGAITQVGELEAFTHAPAVVLRCPYCEYVVARVSETPNGTFVDLRGSTYVRLGGEGG